MSSTEHYDDSTSHDSAAEDTSTEPAAGEYRAAGSSAPENTGGVLGAAQEVIEVRRNGGLAGLVGVVSSIVAIAWLARAVQSGSLMDWVLFAVIGLLGVVWLHAFVDARTPLLVADELGVRLRLGRVWRGLPWGAIASVEHKPRRGLFRDGRIAIHPHNLDRVLAEMDASGRRQSAVSERLHGAPLAVPLGLSTRVNDLREDLTTSLRVLAGDVAQVVEIEARAKKAAHEHDNQDSDNRDWDAHDGETDGDTDGDTDWDTGLNPPSADPVGVTHGGASGLFGAPSDEIDGEDRDHPEAPEDDSERDSSEPEPTSRLRTSLLGLRSSIAGRLARSQPPRHLDEDARRLWAELDGPDGDPGETADRTPGGSAGPAPMMASPTPTPLRDPASVARIEVQSNLFVEGNAARKLQQSEIDTGLPEGRELRRDGSVNLVEDTVVWSDRVRPISTAGDPVEPLVIDDFGIEPAIEPIIGPDLAAARTRLGLSVDALAGRTRIRPHVIESIEVDDFHACGGDFYARGHLRTLARVLGLDIAPLLKSYDEKYADAPINPRRVFEADLASSAGGGLRATRGGPNWSMLVAVVMALVLAWSIARLAMDAPVEIQNPTPVLNGSDGPNQTAPIGGNVTLKVSSSSSTHLEVRDGNNKVIFSDDVEFGEVHRIDVLPPVRVSADDAGAIDVEIDGTDRGALGADGKKAQKSFRAEQ